MPSGFPAFPYGAVYFRRSNPPREDWARDYRVAAEDGMTAFRHWVLWAAIEVAPGVYDWEVYDRQLDLAAENGMKTIIAEFVATAPEWAFHKYAHARYERADGRLIGSQMGGSSSSGGFPGLCLDNEDVRAKGEQFLRNLAARYKDHPGMGSFDIWNETHSLLCYCPATIEKFREWLKARYGDLKTLGEAWYRYSFAAWEDVQPPRELGPYPDTLDWLQFRSDNAYHLMHWRKEVLRAEDPVHLITAHGTAASLHNMANGSSDEWRAAAEVDVYGMTWGSSRHGDEPWKQYHGIDLVRSGARGKPYWHAEAYAGPLWMQPQVIGKPRDEGRIAYPEDIRFWDMVSFAGGATGRFNLRWRPLLDGPLFGAFGAYGMDGSRTPRSEMASRIAKWVAAQPQQEMWKSRPVKGDIGIIVVPESQLYCYAQQGNTDFYTKSAEGAYQGFFDNNIQADWVHIDDIGAYKALYLPFPIMLKAATAERLREWVAQGGTLISEGCAGYFGDRGKAGQTQPHNGLDAVFGATESYVEFTPDLLGDLTYNQGGRPVWGGVFMQAYTPTAGRASGWYTDGQVAAVDNTFGQGRTRLIGTFPGYGYARHSTLGGKDFFAGLLDWAGVKQHARCSEPRMTARLHAGAGGTYLWVTNPVRRPLPAVIELSGQWGPFSWGETLWGPADVSVDGGTISLTVGGRDAAVIRLQ